MEAILNWLSANPIIANILLAVLIIIILSLIVMFTVAFIQGRDISFYPPKIGPKPVDLERSTKKAVEPNVENLKAVNVTPSINTSEESNKKPSLAVANKQISEDDIKSLLRKHNDDFSRVLTSRDNRYLKATTTDKGIVQAKQNAVSLLDYMQENKIEFTRLVEISLLNWRLVSDGKVVATTDETWEEKYVDGHTSQLIDRNIYEIVLTDGVWLIDSCEVLPPVEKGLTAG